MNQLRIARDGYILISVIFYIAGLVYLILPEISSMALCIASGILLIVYGIIKIIGYFSNDLYCLAFQYDLGCGLLLIVVGIIVIIYNLNIQQYLSPGLGLLILLDSMLKIQISKDAKIFGLERWYLILILSIVTGVFGVLIIIMSFGEMSISRTINGCGILVEGFMNHLFIRNTVKIMKDCSLQDKNEQNTEE